MEQSMSRRRSDNPGLSGLAGQTIDSVEWRPYCSGLDGACERIVLTTTSGLKWAMVAGSYCIPEEACIYVEPPAVPDG